MGVTWECSDVTLKVPLGTLWWEFGVIVSVTRVFLWEYPRVTLRVLKDYYNSISGVLLGR